MRTKTEIKPPEPLLKQREIERRYGVSRWTVAQWLDAGCPVTRLPSGHKRFDLNAVAAWMDEQQPNAASA